MITVYGGAGSAQALAKELGGYWWSKESRLIRRWSPRRADGRAGWVRVRDPRLTHVVNYGYEAPGMATKLNSRISSDKLRQLQLFRDAGLSVPDFSTTPPNEPGWLVRNRSHVRGRDIRHPQVSTPQVRTEWRPDFQLHDYQRCGHCLQVGGAVQRAQRIEVPGAVRYPQGDYYVKFLPKQREFRVHVFNETIMRMSEKLPQRTTDTVWNSANSHFSHAEITPREVRHGLCDVARRALAAVGLDFGAVDVMMYNNQLYVLEVNSAPSLTDNPTTLQRYANHIREWANGM